MVKRRAGRTVKVSVSIDRDDLLVLRRHAKTAHQGNLSAAFAEAARWIRQREARLALVELLGGPTLTSAAAKAIDAEQSGEDHMPRKKAKPTRAA